jgi:hypothetical protein
MQGFDERATCRGFLFAGWLSRTTLIAGILKFHANIGCLMPILRSESQPGLTRRAFFGPQVADQRPPSAGTFVGIVAY